MQRAYLPHDDFIAPARRQAALWRLLPGALLIFVAYICPLLLIGMYLSTQYGAEIAEVVMQHMVRGETPGGMLLLLWSFLGLAIGPMAAVRLLHGRGAGTLIGPSLRRAGADFAKVFLPILALQIGLLPFLVFSEDIRPGISLAAFLGYLPFALPGILIQTGAEELVFRGYLQQQLAARFRMPAIWMGVPSALFAWGHYLPAEFGANAWAITAWAAVFGCLAADLTARTGNLGAALGFHCANNVVALLFVGLAGNLDGLALWSLTLDLSNPAAAMPALTVDFAAMITSWLLARLCLRR